MTRDDNSVVSELNLQSASRRKQPQKGGPKLIPAAALLVILLLILLVIRVQKRKEAALEASLAESASIEASMEASRSEAEALQRPETVPFLACEIPELTMLAEDYFDARMQADTSRILTLYGRADTSEDTDLKAKLEAQASWIQGYRNLRLYDVPGIEEGERLCLLTYDIDFRRTDTLAPGILYFYVRRNAGGEYRILENLPKDRYDYTMQELESPSAGEMIADVNRRLREALAGDSDLALIYTSFANGEIYRETDLELDREQEVDLFLDPADSILLNEEDLARMSEEAASRTAADPAADPSNDTVVQTEPGEEAPADAGEDTGTDAGENEYAGQ